MTGHGRGNATAEGWRITVECGSVNRKGIEISVALPKTISTLEQKIRETVQKRVNRGRVNITVLLESSGRNTAGFVMAGAIAQKLLDIIGVKILAHTVEIGGIKTNSRSLISAETIDNNPLKCVDPKAAQKMLAAIAQAGELLDHGTRDMLTSILKDEEGHIDWLEAQKDQVSQMGIQIYLSLQVKE